MVKLPISPAIARQTPAAQTPATQILTEKPSSISAEYYDAAVLPPDCYDEVPEGMEKVDGKPVEKTYMTLKHADTQLALGAEWRAYSRASRQGGQAYTEALCQTQVQKRRPDVSYVTEELHQAHGQPATFPQSFPLIGEIASPDDAAEMLFAKAYEYLASGAEEVWILLPESKLAFIVLADQVLAFNHDQEIATQKVLKGFAIALSELFAKS